MRISEIMDALRQGGRLNAEDWALITEMTALFMMRDARPAPQTSSERVRAFRERKADETMKRVSVSQVGNIDSNYNNIKPPISPKPLKRSTPLPEGWAPGEPELAWATGKGFPATFVKAQTERMTNWALGRGAARKDWAACWRNWLLKAWEDGGTMPRYQKQANVIGFQREWESATVRQIEERKKEKQISSEEREANLAKLKLARNR